MEPIILESRISKNIKDNRKYFHEKLNVDVNFDMLYRDITIGGKDSVIYFIDGFCKDELMQKMEADNSFQGKQYNYLNGRALDLL